VLILQLRQSEVALADGRLDEVFQLLAANPIASHRRGQRVISRLVDALIRRGGEHLADNHFSEALADCEKAGKLAGNQPKIVSLREAALAGWTAEQKQRRAVNRVDAAGSPQMPAASMQREELLPSQFVLHADGVGSFLVLRQPAVTIGPVGGAVASDIGLIAEPTLPPLTVERVEDDYFLRSGKDGKGKLLASGDRLELSPRCRLKFSVPNQVSTTAVLDLSGARLPRLEIRRVILMDQDLIIGPNSASHVQVSGISESMVLHVRHGRLYCQTRLPLMVDDVAGDVNFPLPLGANVKTDGLSFAVAR
jgi:hypothetical protein